MTLMGFEPKTLRPAVRSANHYSTGAGITVLIVALNAHAHTHTYTHIHSQQKWTQKQNKKMVDNCLFSAA